MAGSGLGQEETIAPARYVEVDRALGDDMAAGPEPFTMIRDPRRGQIRPMGKAIRRWARFAVVESEDR